MSDATPFADGPSLGPPDRLLLDKHTAFLANYDDRKDTFEYAAIEHRKMSCIYWIAAALYTVKHDSLLDKEGVLKFIAECRTEGGGYAGHAGHDAHLLGTLSALQLLAMLERPLPEEQAQETGQWIAALQRRDGSFVGDSWGEVDSRFSYCALASLALLDKLDLVDLPASCQYVRRCGNADGGFGAVPGAESHAGQAFVCAGALSIACAHMALHPEAGQAVAVAAARGAGSQAAAAAGVAAADASAASEAAAALAGCRAVSGSPGLVLSATLPFSDADRLGIWLSARQCDSGGLNGRPEKQADVCYSWWVLSAMSIAGRTHWLGRNALVRFILECQDPDGGGISDRPGDVVDPFHTYFGLAGLSLLGALQDLEVDHLDIDPTYALPRGVVRRLGLPRLQVTPAPVYDAEGGVVWSDQTADASEGADALFRQAVLASARVEAEEGAE